jgi:VWFA-related protein
MRKTGILFTQAVMGQNGEGAVVTFSDDIDKLQDFTTSDDLIESTIAHIGPGTQGNKLYDAINVGVEMLSHRPQATADTPGKRRVLMIVSEASDIGSGARLGEVLRRAQLANVTIYSIGLSTTQTPTTEEQRDTGIDLMAAAVAIVQHVDNAVKNRALELATVATGGSHLYTFRDRSIEKAIDELGGELHAQYAISYTPEGTNEFGYHEIKVTVDKKGLKVRARPGYFVPSPGS